MNKKHLHLTVTEVDYCNIRESSVEFKLKYIEQAIFINRHFLVLILIGFFSLIFSPSATASDIVNSNIEFINALMLGVGISGIVCWVIAYKTKGKINMGVWRLCHILLNFSHILSVLIFLFFFITVGARPDGRISSLACGVFSSIIIGILLSMRNAYRL